jgi:hypothetical protein
VNQSLKAGLKSCPTRVLPYENLRPYESAGSASESGCSAKALAERRLYVVGRIAIWTTFRNFTGAPFSVAGL